MIRHFLEIWLLLALAFTLGGVFGALLYVGLARSPLAVAQGAFADAIGDLIDAIKGRLGGFGPVWRPDVARGARRHSRDFEDDDPFDYEPDIGDEVEPAAPVRRGQPASLDDHDDGWEGTEADANWDEEPAFDGDAGDEVRQVAAAERAPRTASPPPKPELPAMRPAGLAAPRNGVPDNLQRIRGIGQKNEEMLNSLGIFHFGQIAAWTPAEVRWIAAHMAFPERAERDDWIGQATVLATGRDTGYVKAERRKADDEAAAEEESG